MNIGILSSGGDAPGMNAAIRAVTRAAQSARLSVFGVRRGYNGLITGDLFPLDHAGVANIIQRGGTILGTARSEEFMTAGGMKRAAQNMARYRLDALVVIGGEGTMRGADVFTGRHRFRLIGLPATIDNDLFGTDFTIGFDTAVNNALEAIDRIRDTASSLERIFFIEVMGRTAGFIGLTVGLAAGAEEVLIPETPTDIDQLSRLLQHNIKKGKKTNIVVVAEGDEAGNALEIAKKVKKKTGEDCRVAVLGYIQRGGAPSARDRVLASQLGYEAVQALRRGISGVMVGEVNGKTVFTKFRSTYRRRKKLDLRLYKTLITLAE
jgi:6-phosphofructokinase 1